MLVIQMNGFGLGRCLGEEKSERARMAGGINTFPVPVLKRGWDRERQKTEIFWAVLLVRVHFIWQCDGVDMRWTWLKVCT